MKWKKVLTTLKNKKILSLVFLVTIALTTIFGVHAIKSSTAHSNNSKNALPSVEDVAKNILLDKSGATDSWIPGKSKNKSDVLANLAHLDRDLDYSRKNTYTGSNGRRNDGMDVGKYFEKGSKAILVADNSNDLLILAQNNQSSGGSTQDPSSDRSTQEEGWLKPPQHLTPGPDMTAGSSGPEGSGPTRTTSDKVTEDDPQPPSPTPEPVTLLLFGSGLVGLAVAKRRSMRSSKQ